MRIGIFSDIHLQEDLGNSVLDTMWGTSRLKEIVNSVMSAFKVFKHYGVELILDLGDDFNEKTSVSIMVFNAFAHILRQAPAPIIGISSNHGSWDKIGTKHLVHTFASHGWTPDKIWDFKVAAEYAINFADKILIFGVTYTPDSEMDLFNGRCDRINKEYHEILESKHKNSYKIIMMHQGIKEAKLKNAPQNLEKVITASGMLKVFSWADLILAGHYHDSQRIHSKFIIPGAICQHNYKDVGGKRGFWIHDTETKVSQFFPSKSPQFRIFKVDQLKEIKPEYKDDYIRVIVENNTQANKIEKHFKDWPRLHCLIKSKAEEVALRDSSMNLQTDHTELLSKYIRNKNPQGLDQKLLNRLGQEIIKNES